MPPYKQMYFSLFNAITDALRSLDEQNYTQAKAVLMAAQCAAEELYIGTGESRKAEECESSS